MASAALTLTLTLTLLDLPELEAILEEAIDAVPAWERDALRARLQAIRRRAEEHRLLHGDPFARPPQGILTARGLRGDGA